MSYWQLYYHMIWGTLGREPWITPRVEPVVHGFLREKAVALGAKVFALDGTEDHVHLVASVPPSIALSRFIGQIKAVASTRLNKSGLLQHSFFWQEDFGLFSFDRKRLPTVVAYVEGQKQHHATGTTISALERFPCEKLDSSSALP